MVKGPAWWVWLPWALLGVLMTTSVLNRSYEVLDLPDGQEIIYAVENVAQLPGTIDADRTVTHGTRLLCAALLLACVLYGLPSARWQRYLLTTLVAHAVVLSLLGIYYKLTGATLILGRFEAPNATFFATYRYHNQWGAFALLHLGMALCLITHLREHHGPLSRPQNPAVFWLATLPLLALTIPLSTGRASVMALALFIVVMGMILGYRGGLTPSAKTDGRKRRHLIMLIVTLCLLVISATVYVAGDALRPRWYATVDEISGGFQSGSITTRLAASRITLDMIAERPLWGWGLGSFVHVFPFFAGDSFLPGDTWIMQFAHNDWLQYVAELGLAGVLLLAGTPLLLLINCHRADTSPARIWLWVALVSLGLVALLDFPMANPSIQVLVALTFALSLRLNPMRGPAH